MKVEQAVFASAENARMKGYQLVARSEGIDRDIAQELCRWSPSHAALVGESADTWSLNYFPIDPSTVALARTTYGGAEYSARGGMQVVTMYLVLSTEEFSAYQYNAVSLARTVMALGYLRLPRSLSEPSEVARIPDRPFLLRRRRTANSMGTVPAAVLERTVKALRDGQRVVVHGDGDPIGFTEDLIAELPPEERVALSFTTGLQWSMRRSFQLHFLPQLDVGMRQKLSAQGMHCIGAA